jgi:CHAD domain-containing protein
LLLIASALLLGNQLGQDDCHMKMQHVDLSVSLGNFSHGIICQNLKKFVAQEKDVLKDKDLEPLHQMRVGMRRLRTAVDVFDSALVLPKNVSNSLIGKIAKSLGETRDLDVLKQELTLNYQPLLPKEEQSKFDKVLERLSQTRNQSYLDLKKVLTGDRYQTLKQSLQSWQDQPTFTAMADVSVLQILPDLVLPSVCQLFLHPGWLVGTTLEDGTAKLLPIEQPEQLKQQLAQFESLLHGLRKQTKGVRYQAEFFLDFYEASYADLLQDFKAIQEILGQLQDQTVLRQFLETTLKADLAKVLPTIHQKMQATQLEFWQTWQPFQHRYLSSEFRQRVRSQLINPLQLKPSSTQLTQKVTKTNCQD